MMKAVLSLLLWAGLVGLQVGVSASFSVGFCDVGMEDLGGAVWSLGVAREQLPIHALLLFSPMVLMPMGRCLFGATLSAPRGWLEFSAAFLLGLSLLFEPVDPRALLQPDPQLRRWVPASFFLALPWLVLRAWAAGQVLRCWCDERFTSPGRCCIALAQIFPAVGAAWLVAHRAQWTPWGFDPLIVLLTAAHFHHAGYTLPLLAGLNAQATPGRVTTLSCVAILAGVPWVAVGITGTHFGVLPLLEPLGVCVLVLGALGVAASQLRMSLHAGDRLRTWPRVAFFLSGVSLALAMFLALGFGLRHLFPLYALTMPQMWMIHGSLNTFGFGLCGLLAWRGMAQQAKPCSA